MRFQRILLCCLLLGPMTLCAEGTRIPGNLLSSETSTFEQEKIPKGIIPGWDDSKARITDQTSFRGSRSLELEFEPEGKLKGVFIPVPGAPFREGEVLTISAYVKGDAPGTVNLVFYACNELWKPLQQDSAAETLSQSWRQLKLTATLKQDIKFLFIYIAPWKYRGKMFVDEVKAEPGKKATPGFPERIPPKTDLKNVFFIPLITEKLSSPDDPLWQKLPKYDRFCLKGKDFAAPPEKTIFQCAADEENLYFKFHCFLPEMKKLKCYSSREQVNWNDDRVEIHFSPAGESRRSSNFYFSVNAKGVPAGLEKCKGIQIRTRENQDGYEVFFAIPQSCFGTKVAEGHLWKLNAGRFHRTAFNGASALCPFDNHFGDQASFGKFVFTRSGKIPEAVLAEVGEMSAYANVSGGNLLRFDFLEKVPEGLVLKLKDGQILPPAKQSAGKSAIFFYTVGGVDGERLAYQLLSDGRVLTEGDFNLALLAPANRVFQTPDPLFGPFKKEKRSRKRPMMTWDAVLAKSNYDAALKTGVEYSAEAVEEALRTAGISVMTASTDELNPEIPSLRKGQYYTAGRGGLERYAGGVKAGKYIPITVYSRYYISGEDPETGEVGISRDKNGYWGWIIDPINRQAYFEFVEALMKTYGKEIGIFFLGDEFFVHQKTVIGLQLNTPFNMENPTRFIQKFNEKVKHEYGGGIYDIPFNAKNSDPDYKWRNFAYGKALGDETSRIAAKAREIVRKYNPDTLFLSDDAYGSLMEQGVQYWNRYADCGSFQIGEGGGTTGRDFPSYMFRTKIVKDISLLPDLIPVPHEPVDGYPTGALNREEMIELYSQMIRGGATGFHFWPYSYGGRKPPSVQAPSVVIGNPDSWKYMIEVTKMFNRLPDPLIPDEPETAILAPECLFDYAPMMAAFTMLGIRPHGWFKYVCDLHIIEGKADLSRYKILYIPSARAVSPQLFPKLRQFLEGGGTMVCADPAFASTDQLNRDLSAEREKLFGIIPGAEGKGDILFRNVHIPAQKKDAVLRFVSEKPEVVARYSDGSPAGVLTRVGKGKAYFFGFRIFTEKNAANPDFCRAVAEFHKSLGGTTGHTLWRFKLPHPKVTERELGKGTCLTGNYGFWERHFFYSGIMNNVRFEGKIRADGRDTTKLTDRLSVFEREEEYKKGAVDSWVERFGKGSHKVTIAFDRVQDIRSIVFYFSGKMPEMRISADGSSFTVPSTETRDREVAGSVFAQKLKASRIELDFTVSGDKEFTLAEVEVWQ